MGVKSTYDISREVALEVIHAKLSSLSNDRLGNILEQFHESQFRNYDVLDWEPEAEDDEARIITSVEDFNIP